MRKPCSLSKATGLDRCVRTKHLRPRLRFRRDEQDLIVKLHALLGNRWSLIAGRLPGRTDNEIKNYWNSHIRKKLIGMGIDPNNYSLSQLLPHFRHNSIYYATSLDDDDCASSASSSNN